jgi:HK97 family phage major capsid protein
LENQITPDQIVEKINTMITEKMATQPTMDDVNHIKSELETLKSFETKSIDIEKSIARMEGRIESMNEKSITSKPEPVGSIGHQITKHLKGDKLEQLKGGKGFDLDVKADTTIAGDYTGTIALSELDSDVNRIQRQSVLISNVVNRGLTNSMYVTYIQQTAQPTSAWVTEAYLKTEYEEKYTEVSKQVKKVAGLVKVSKEMLSDLSFVQNEINTDLVQGVLTGMDNSLLNGAGGTDLEGLLSFAPVFSAAAGTPFSLSIFEANILDVIRVAMSQIQSAKFEPSHVILHPIDVAKMQLTKTSTGEYSTPFWYPLSTGEMRVTTLTIISTTFMTAGNFLVGDMSRSNLRMRENVNIQVGYVNDDFARNMVTILAEARAVHYVKLNDVNAFVKGTFSTAIALINKP